MSSARKDLIEIWNRYRSPGQPEYRSLSLDEIWNSYPIKRPEQGQNQDAEVAGNVQPSIEIQQWSAQSSAPQQAQSEPRERGLRSLIAAQSVGMSPEELEETVMVLESDQERLGEIEHMVERAYGNMQRYSNSRAWERIVRQTNDLLGRQLRISAELIRLTRGGK